MIFGPPSRQSWGDGPDHRDGDSKGRCVVEDQRQGDYRAPSKIHKTGHSGQQPHSDASASRP